jgi:hypothetical protein
MSTEAGELQEAGGCRCPQLQRRTQMRLHGNARTCLHSRLLIVERVLEQGWTVRLLPRPRA